MRVGIRADGSATIGAGHSARCLTIAQALIARGHSVELLGRDPSPIVRAMAERANVPCLELDLPPLPAPQAPMPDAAADAEATLQAFDGADLLVVDHYSIDADWESRLRAGVNKILVIDDLANRPHDCDGLLDTAFNDRPGRYEGLVPDQARRWMGPSFALLRPEFAQLRKTVERRREVRSVLVSFGGFAVPGGLAPILRRLNDSLPKVEIVATVSTTDPSATEALRVAEELDGVQAHLDPTDVARLMTEADLGIGAAGTMTWERLCLGLPSVVALITPNQRDNGKGLALRRLASVIDEIGPEFVDEVVRTTCELASDPDRTEQMSRLALKTIDANGADRLAASIFAPNVRLREAEAADARELFRWANDPGSRATSITRDPIPWETHVAWFDRKLKDPNCHLWIVVDESGRAVGQTRFDVDPVEQKAVVSVGLAPDERSKGLGSAAIHVATERFRRLRPNHRVDAFIRPDNVASIKAFDRAGYRYDRDESVQDVHLEVWIDPPAI